MYPHFLNVRYGNAIVEVNNALDWASIGSLVSTFVGLRRRGGNAFAGWLEGRRFQTNLRHISTAHYPHHKLVKTDARGTILWIPLPPLTSAPFTSNAVIMNSLP